MKQKTQRGGSWFRKTNNQINNNMYTLLFIGTQEIIIIALVVLLLFGGKKIPELMRGLGKGVKSFRDGASGIGEEINNAVNTGKNE